MQEKLINDLKIDLLMWKNAKVCNKKIAVKFFLTYQHIKSPNKITKLLLQDESMWGQLTDFNFKHIKKKAIIALTKWYNNEWEFELMDKIPSPHEVLYYQAIGKRPVSIIFQESLSPILQRQDCLDFFTHDLEHGHMFFHDENLKLMQLDFFKKVYLHRLHPRLEELKKDFEFKQKFHYLISDMNSHTEHYRYYLKAILSKRDFDIFEDLFF